MRESIAGVVLFASCLPVLGQGYSLAANGARPLAGSMAFDARRNVVAIVEGNNAQRRMWEWDGSAFHPIVGPAHEGVANLVHDPVRGELHGSLYNGIATWDGARWRITPGIGSIAAIAFDAARGRLVALGAVGQEQVVMEWDGAQWSTSRPAVQPDPNGPLVFDAARGRCVLASGAPLALWTWDGTRWTLLDASGPPLSPATLRLVHDPAANRLVLHGVAGTALETWTFDAAGWTQLATPAAFGSGTSSMAWDGTGVLRLDATMVWRLEGATWRQLPFAVPLWRSMPAIAATASRRGIVLFGGGSFTAPLADTWTMDAGRWRRETPATVPPARTEAGLAWSAADQAFVLFGGKDASGPLGDTWLWNGTDWNQLQVTVAPPARSRHAFVQEPGGGALLVGGYAPATTFTDHWRFVGNSWTNLGTAPRAGSGLLLGAFDPLRQRSVLILGDNPQEWDGNAWTALPQLWLSGLPVGAAFDPASQRVWAFAYGSYPAASWDGTSWRSETMQPGSVGQTMSIATDFADQRAWDVFTSSYAPQGGMPAVLTPTPATAATFGWGCALGASPGLSCHGRPRVGTASFAIDTATLLPGAPLGLALGFVEQPQHLGAGCVAWLANPPLVQFLVADAAGRARLPLPLPANPSLRGLAVLAQAAVVDPARSQGGLLTLTDGLRVAIGD